MAYVVCMLSMVLLDQVLKLLAGNCNPHEKAHIRSFTTHLLAQKIIPASYFCGTRWIDNKRASDQVILLWENIIASSKFWESLKKKRPSS